MKALYYLASPYTHADAAVMEERFLAACKAAAALMNRGLIVFSPIAHTHPIAVNHALPRGWEFWKEMDETIIVKCDAIAVLTIDGWRESTGVAAEREIARGLELPEFYVDERRGYALSNVITEGA